MRKAIIYYMAKADVIHTYICPSLKSRNITFFSTEIKA
jgi:hypothetical protein